MITLVLNSRLKNIRKANYTFIYIHHIVSGVFFFFNPHGSCFICGRPKVIGIVLRFWTYCALLEAMSWVALNHGVHPKNGVIGEGHLGT